MKTIVVGFVALSALTVLVVFSNLENPGREHLYRVDDSLEQAAGLSYSQVYLASEQKPKDTPQPTRPASPQAHRTRDLPDLDSKGWEKILAQVSQEPTPQPTRRPAMPQSHRTRDLPDFPDGAWDKILAQAE